MTGTDRDGLAEGRALRYLIAGVIALVVLLGVAWLFYAFLDPPEQGGRNQRRAWRLTAMVSMPLAAGTFWLVNGMLRMRAARRQFDAEEARKRAAR